MGRRSKDIIKTMRSKARVSEERWDDGDEEFGVFFNGSSSSNDESLYEMMSDSPADSSSSDDFASFAELDSSELDSSCEDVDEDNSALDLESDKRRKLELSGGVITLRNSSSQLVYGSLPKNACPHPGVFAGMCVACGKNLGDEFGVGLEYIHKMKGWRNSSCEAAQTSPQCKKGKLKAINIESFSDDILFEILVRVPAQDIYDSTRLVCRKWHKMIQTRNFVYSHCLQSTHGLLGLSKRTFIAMQNGRTEISKLSYWCEGKVLSSCNGLLLERRENLKEPYITITNPVTKQQFALPWVALPSEETNFNFFAMEYAASSRAYKVVHISDSNGGKYCGCAIMTVGVDMDWGRHVSTQHLSNTAKMLLTESPLTTQGFVHWAKNGWDRKSNIDCVLTMNIESETITQIPGPCLCLDGEVLRYCYLPMGSYLSLLIGERSSWEAWKMKPETGEWTKMPSIDMEPMFKYLSFGLYLSPKLNRLAVGRWPIPIGWSNTQEVLFFSVCLRIPKTPFYMSIPNIPFLLIAAYNVRTQEISSPYELDSMETLFVEHKSSLVWLD